MSDCPSDSVLIDTYFIEGPLGVTLKRRPNDGPIYVFNLIENSQAIGKNIEVNDEIWSVASTVIGVNEVKKEDWDRLIEVMQKSKRPLRIVWRRRFTDSMPRPSKDVANNISTTTITQQLSNDDTENGNEHPLQSPLSTTQDEDELQLNKLISRLTLGSKDAKDKQSKLPECLNKKNQKVIVTSHVFVEKPNSNNTSNNNTSSSATGPALAGLAGVNTMWNNLLSNTGIIPQQQPPVKRFLILLTDALLVTIPSSESGSGVGGNNNNNNNGDIPSMSSSSSALQIEYAINLFTCKLSDSSSSVSTALGMGLGLGAISQQIMTRTMDECSSSSGCHFLITWPGGSLNIIFKSADEREFWFNKVLATAVECSGYDSQYHLLTDATAAAAAGQSRSATAAAATVSTALASVSATVAPVKPPRVDRNNASASASDIMNYSIHDLVVRQQHKKLKALLAHITTTTAAAAAATETSAGTNDYNDIDKRPTIDIDETNDDGYTALHLACMFQYHQSVQALFQADANICYADSQQGFTPLHWAALLLDYKSLNILLAHIIDPDMNDSLDRTPLLLACAFGQTINYSMLEHHNQADRRSATTAGADTDDARSRVDDDADSQYSDTNDFHTMLYNRMLSKKSRRALTQCVSILLSRRADPCAADIDGIPALHYLAASWQHESIKLLVKNGANAHKLCSGPSKSSCASSSHGGSKSHHKSESGNALHQALQGKMIKNTEFVELRDHLYSAITHAQATYSHSSKHSPIGHHQHSSSSPSPSKHSLTHKSRPTSTNTIALYRKINHSNQYLNPQYGVHTVRALLQAGCRPNARNQRGLLPLQILLHSKKNWKKSKISVVIIVLLQYGARLDLLDSAEQHSIKLKYGVMKNSNKSINDHGMEKNQKKKKHVNGLNSEANSDVNDEDEDASEEAAETDSSDEDRNSNKNSEFDTNATAGGDADEIAAAIRASDDELYASETNESMSVERAVEMWNNKGDVSIDAIGLGLNSLKSDEDDCEVCFLIDGKGKDEKAAICVLCSTAFGMFKRKNRCRLCDILCCDDCSKKRVIIANSKKERVCDSCYNITSNRVREWNARTKRKAIMETASAVSTGTGFNPAVAANVITIPTNSSRGSSDDDYGSSDSPLTFAASAAHDRNSPRSQLFSGSTQSANQTESNGSSRYSTFRPSNTKINFIKVDKSVVGSTDAERGSTNAATGTAGVQSTISTMNELNERLKNRGEKLSELGERTEQLSNQASEFAQMSKELANRQKRSNTFLGLF